MIIHQLKPLYNKTSKNYEYRQTPHLLNILFTLDKLINEYNRMVKNEDDPNFLRSLIEEDGDKK